MSNYAYVSLGELFNPATGRPRFIRDYMDAHPGEYPVYSASLTQPFGHVDEFEFEGLYLTWVMNGYGGRVQEVEGRFSTNRDRGVLVPLDGIEVPDLTYLRFAMEPQLMATAVGRRVDGRLNEYTKIYPDAAREVVIRLPLDRAGRYDYPKMAELGARFRRIEQAQAEVKAAEESLTRAAFAIDIPAPFKTVGLDSRDLFSLSIGKRVLRVEHSTEGIPVYSANALVAFGRMASSNLSDFSKPSLLWGIDGNFDWNLIGAGEEFATTDHCGRLQILHDQIDAEYVYQFLKATRARHGFDRVYRASLGNMKAEVTVTLPLDPVSGQFSLERQRALADSFRRREESRDETLRALQDVLKARLAVEL